MHEVDHRDGESDDESDAYLGTFNSESAVLSSNLDEPCIIDLKVGQAFIRFKIDCGANVTVTSENMSLCMIFPTMRYVRPAKPQISLRMRAD